MFDELQMAPPDPILGLTEAFRNDSNPQKINLGVGVYQSDEGVTPIFSAVKQAEANLLAEQQTKSYLPIAGSAEFAAAVQAMVFGGDHEIVTGARSATAQAPGGTGAVRVAGDFLKAVGVATKVWVSDPTWSNHFGILAAAGFQVDTYPYYDAANACLDFDRMLAALRTIPSGDVVLLHGCCHNPSGMDPTIEQWRQIAAVLAERKLLALVDFAYQGFGEGLDEDAAGVRALCDTVDEVLIASSFSKNFGLYSERTGALTAVCASAETAAKALSHIKTAIRRNYSNPPGHGAAIVTAVLTDSSLRAEWEQELSAVRDRIHEMRRLFVQTLKAKGVDRDFSFITRQSGMFSFSGLTKDQVQTLREQHSIYIVGSGRINVAGMTRSNMDRLCGAIANVL